MFEITPGLSSLIVVFWYGSTKEQRRLLKKNREKKFLFVEYKVFKKIVTYLLSKLVPKNEEKNLSKAHQRA